MATCSSHAKGWAGQPQAGSIRTPGRRARLAALLVAGAWALAAGAAEPRRAKLPTNLPRTPTRFYDIYSRLDEATLQEAAARLTAMAKDYHRRTSGFPRSVKAKLPIYLFDNAADYEAAGGLEGSHGIYLGEAAQAAKPLWLPESLLTQDLWVAERLKTWRLDSPGRFPELSLQIDGVGTFTGSFELDGTRSVDVRVRGAKD